MKPRNFIKLGAWLHSTFIQLNRAFLFVFLVNSLLSFGLILYDLGVSSDMRPYISFQIYFLLSLFLYASRYTYTFFRYGKNKSTSFVITSIFISILPIVLLIKKVLFNRFLSELISIEHERVIVYSLLMIYSLSSLAGTLLKIASNKLKPTLIFTSSFLFFILLGTFCLLLPNATHSSINFTDALFTSCSALCVTGLSVVDTYSTFSPFGQVIILSLIQIGGLGVMTFTTFFGILLASKTNSFREGMIFKELMDLRSIGNLNKTLGNIILLTLIIEILGCFFIYISIHDVVDNPLWTALFHSVSAFCNAGFSTLDEGLYNPAFRHLYLLQISMFFLIALGGIGLPILTNVFAYIKMRSRKTYYHLLGYKNTLINQPRILNLNSRLALIATGLIILVGSLFFFFLEKKSIGSEEPILGRFISSLFMSVSFRTAGFSNIEMGTINSLSLFFICLLMWIGGSPNSTGGGIKTTTFSIAIINIVSLIRGKERPDIFKRRISSKSIQLAFSIIFLSASIIFISSVAIFLIEKGSKFEVVFFEVVSAISTTGLSINFTPTLSISSKCILCVLMYLGRVGFVTLLISLIKQEKTKNYSYPTENILLT